MNGVTLVNEVEMLNTLVEDEDDLLFRFIDHLKEEQIAHIEVLEDGELVDIDMDNDTFSMVVHMGWHDEDDGFNIAGPSNQPF